MTNYKEFEEKRLKSLKKIFKKSYSWIDSNINYNHFKKIYLLDEKKLNNIIESLKEKKLSEKKIINILYLIGYSYAPVPAVEKFYPSVIHTSSGMEKRGLVKYYIFPSESNIFISFRGTKTLWESINNLKFYRVKFDILSQKEFNDFITWRDNTTSNNNFNKEKIPLPDDKDIEVHKGFLDEANYIYQEIIDKISEIINPSCKKTNIILCGHSLGGCLATFMSIYISFFLQTAIKKDKLSISLITANSPPMGNKNFNLLILYLNIKNYVRFYNYQDFVPYYGYYGSWIDSKKFRHLDYMFKHGLEDVNKAGGRIVNGRLSNTNIFVKDFGKNLELFLKKIQLNQDKESLLTRKLIFHDFFSIIKKNKVIFI